MLWQRTVPWCPEKILFWESWTVQSIEWTVNESIQVLVSFQASQQENKIVAEWSTATSWVEVVAGSSSGFVLLVEFGWLTSKLYSIWNCVLLRNAIYRWNAGNFNRATLCVHWYVNRVYEPIQTFMNVVSGFQSTAAGDRVFEWWIRRARKVAKEISHSTKDVSNLRMWSFEYTPGTRVETLEFTVEPGQTSLCQSYRFRKIFILWTYLSILWPNEWSDLDWWQETRVTLIDT